MPRLIAIATDDGETVFQHFGHSRVFQIAEVGKTGFRVIEKRVIPLPDPSVSRHVGVVETACSALSDCSAIIAGKLGQGATNFLASKGILAFETIGYVNEILRELSEEYDFYFADE
ncbi:MAG: hypothetical protein LBQ68_07565 [Clostridiales bacterium]|jgi:predicted Fe-Mo cluster-binding NifX family protein|nr:hypothetical protein [Clostridiales bacterium]